MNAKGRGSSIDAACSDIFWIWDFNDAFVTTGIDDFCSKTRMDRFPERQRKLFLCEDRFPERQRKLFLCEDRFPERPGKLFLCQERFPERLGKLFLCQDRFPERLGKLFLL